MTRRRDRFGRVGPWLVAAAALAGAGCSDKGKEAPPEGEVAQVAQASCTPTNYTVCIPIAWTVDWTLPEPQTWVGSGVLYFGVLGALPYALEPGISKACSY